MNKFLHDEDIEDKIFIDSLTFSDLKEKYADEKKALFSSIDKEHTEKREDSAKKKLKGIEQDLKHRMVLNSCIFPCLSDNGELSKLGYQFIRASPLHEKKVSNFDFLLFHSDFPTIAIFGEAKGNISDYGGVVDQTKARIKIVQEHQSYINSTYLNGTNSGFEYVLGVNWPDANETKKSIVRKGGGIILWNSGIIPGIQNKEVLSLIAPGKEDGSAGKSMFHKDDNLNNRLKQIETSYQCKDIFLESHRFAKLRLINYAARKKEDNSFTFDDLKRIVTDELFYVPDAIIYAETEEIIRYAKDNLKYIEDISEAHRKYKINSKKKKTNLLDQELQSRWLDYELEYEAHQEKIEQLKEIQERYAKERSARKTLDDPYT